jgi:hypothetical protein
MRLIGGGRVYYRWVEGEPLVGRQMKLALVNCSFRTRLIAEP